MLFLKLIFELRNVYYTVLLVSLRRDRNEGLTLSMHKYRLLQRYLGGLILILTFLEILLYCSMAIVGFMVTYR